MGVIVSARIENIATRWPLMPVISLATTYEQWKLQKR
jgi:hypothetical protein